MLFLSCSLVAHKKGYKGHGRDSLSLKEIREFSPKELPAEKVSRIQNILDIRAPSAGIITENGKALFFNWNVTGTYQIWKISKPNGFPIQMTAGNESQFLKDITPDGKHLILSKDTGGDEYYGLYSQSTSGGSIKLIYRKKKVQVFLSFILNNSKSLIFRANDKNPMSYSFYKYNIETKEKEFLFSGFKKGYWVIADHMNVKEYKGNLSGFLLLQLWKGSTASECYLYDLKKKTWTSLFGQDEFERYIARFGKTKNDVIVLTDKWGEFKTLYHFNILNKKSETSKIENEEKSQNQMSTNPQKNLWTPIHSVSNTGFNIDSFQVFRKSKIITYTLNQGGYTVPYAIHLETYKKRSFLKSFFPKVRAEKIHHLNKKKHHKAKEKEKTYKLKRPYRDEKILHISLRSKTRNERFSTLTVQRADSPRESYVYDWKKNQLTQWTKPSFPEVKTLHFTPIHLEHYQARDGTMIPMFVRRPKECIRKACPVIMYFHGGPEAQSRPYFSPYIELFLKDGFVWAAPNVRGSDGYGKTWLHSDNGSKRLNVISDIEDAAIHVRKNWMTQNEVPKIGIFGGSYGGYSAFVGMTLFSGAYDAGVAVVGMSNLLTFLKNTAPYRRKLRVTEYGDPVKDAQALFKLSPINFLNQLKDPILIIHGANDSRVPVGEAFQIYKSMKRKKIPGELIIFEDEGHGIRKRKNQAIYRAHVLEFFNKHLKNIRRHKN